MDLVNFWRTFDPTAGTPNVHPEDADWMRLYWPSTLQQTIYASWEQYAHGRRFASGDKEIHLSLMPVPYVGDLENASVVLFLANPGFVDGDYFLDFAPGMRERLLRNIHQRFQDDYPFLYLDPAFAWCEAYQWWERRFKPLIDHLVHLGRTQQSARAFLARKIAVVELFPYHSVDGSKLKGMGLRNQLPSVQIARKMLAACSHDDRQLKVLLRGHSKWHHETCAPESNHYVHAPKLQTITLNPELPGVRAVWDRLAREL